MATVGVKGLTPLPITVTWPQYIQLTADDSVSLIVVIQVRYVMHSEVARL